VTRALTTAVIGLAAAGAARAAYTALQRRPPGGEKTWTRTNHRGESLTLLEGPAVAVGAVAAALASGSRAGAAMALAGTGAASFGAYDDLAEGKSRKGLRGHLGALAHGEVTTGAVKLGGLGATGLASAVVAGGDPVDVAINAALIAGSANLLNLFDLRPGRAIKVAAISGAALAPAAPLVAAPLGAAAALLPADLAEHAMLGDTGANALGAMLGTAAATSLPRPARLALLSGIVALTGASEKVSFTKVIERTAPLRWLDMLGRRPVAAPPDQ
jgi:UDP-GlcNAc:undecaprenyl-phosphate/decaprenyl-phosphate GlcNAc-1-phosphate transferase